MVDEAWQRGDIEPLAGWNGNRLHDALWHQLAWAFVNPDEVLDAKDRAKVALGRYMHVGAPDEHLGWGDVEAGVLRRYARLLGELLDKEGAAAKAASGD